MAFVSALPFVPASSTLSTSAAVCRVPVRAVIRRSSPRAVFGASQRRVFVAGPTQGLRMSRQTENDNRLIDWNDDEEEDPSVKAENSMLEEFLTFHTAGDAEGGFMPDMFIEGYNFERTTVGEELKKERAARPQPISLADALSFHTGDDSYSLHSEDDVMEDGDFE